MFGSCLSKFFYGESILMETHIMNILSIKVFNWKILFEILYGIKP